MASYDRTSIAAQSLALRAAGAVVVVALCLGAVVGLSWPWARVMTTRLPAHWDPPLHAWKLNFNASQILAGHFILPNYHANFYYPHAYSLCLDDLFWIPAYFTAAVLGLSGNQLLAYNLTFMVFWIISGLFTYLMLREVGLGWVAAAMGAVAFCILPYRLAYYMEFNAQLCFGVPMVTWALVRLLKRPCTSRAMVLAGAIWLQALSAIYYLVIMALASPLIAVAFHFCRPKGPSSPSFKQLIIPLGEALSLAAAGCLVWLYPYYLLYTELHYYRPLSEIARHCAEPLSYLVPGSDFCPPVAWEKWLLPLPAHKCETVLWPGIALALTTVWWIVGPGRIRARRLLLARVVRVGAWAGLAAVVGYAAFTHHLPAPAGWTSLAVNAALAGILLTSVVLAVGIRAETEASALVRALGIAAVWCFVLSLGPRITAGGSITVASNSIMLGAYKFIPVMHATRVVSRYAVVVLMWIVVAGAVAVEGLRRRGLKAAVAGAIVAGMVLEGAAAIRPAYAVPRLRLPPALESKLEALSPCAVVVLPIGARNYDSLYMLVVGDAHPKIMLVNGWTGFGMPLAHTLSRLFSTRGKLPEAIAKVQMLWPQPVILVDNRALAYFNTRGFAATTKGLEQVCKLLYKDEAFTLLLPPERTGPLLVWQWLVRMDLVEHSTWMEFEARSPRGRARGRVELNGTNLGLIELDQNWRHYRVKLVGAPLHIPGNTLSIAASAPIQVKGLRLNRP